MPDKVLEYHVLYVPAASVGFDHHHLVVRPGIDVCVDDVGDRSVDAQRAEGAAAGAVAIDVLDEYVGGWRFDGDTFVFICDHDLGAS